MSRPGFVGPYQLLEKLGAGGMAEVWRAQRTGPGGFNRAVAIKRILPTLTEDPAFVKMFVREARVSARLLHGNIVQVYELGEEDGRYYLAMEFIHGRTLASVVSQARRRGPIAPGLAAFVMGAVCRALAYVHEQKDEEGLPLELIHRDVSPSNIMLTFDGSVKLLDFGIAKSITATKDEQTQIGFAKGKARYMAPEQRGMGALDRRVDVYATGVVLYEVLCGRDRDEAEANPAVPSTVNPEVPADLDRICARAMAMERDHRYASCDAMAVELDEIAHRLKWGPRRVAAVLEELFPGEAEAKDLSLSPPTVTALPKSGHRGRWKIALGILAPVVALVWLYQAWTNSRLLHREVRFAAPTAAPLDLAPVGAAPRGATELIVDSVPGPKTEVPSSQPLASPIAPQKRPPERRHPARKPNRPAPDPSHRAHDVEGGEVVSPFAQ